MKFWIVNFETNSIQFPYRTFQTSCMVWQRGTVCGKRRKKVAEEAEEASVEGAGESPISFIFKLVEFQFF